MSHRTPQPLFVVLKTSKGRLMPLVTVWLRRHLFDEQGGPHSWIPKGSVPCKKTRAQGLGV